MVDRKVSNWNKIKIKSKSKENKIQSESRSWIEIKLKFYKKLNSKINEIFSREITSLIQNTNRLNLNRMHPALFAINQSVSENRSRK